MCIYGKSHRYRNCIFEGAGRYRNCIGDGFASTETVSIKYRNCIGGFFYVCVVHCASSSFSSFFTFHFDFHGRFPDSDFWSHLYLGGIVVGCTSSFPSHGLILSQLSAYRLHLPRPPCRVLVIKSALSNSYTALSRTRGDLKPCLSRMTDHAAPKSPLFLPMN